MTLASTFDVISCDIRSNVLEVLMELGSRNLRSIGYFLVVGSL